MLLEETVEKPDGRFLTGYTGNYIKVYVKIPDAEAEALAPGEFCKVIPAELYMDGVIASVTC